MITGLAALSLDALSSVAYGPEAMMLVLIVAGSGALHWTLPITLAITGMLVLLVISYSQVIEAHPDGGGAYAVCKRNLGRGSALLAAASLVVDYVLTVAVSLAAGAASLGSVFPSLSNHLLLVSLIGLAILTAVNMFGIAESARLLLFPAAIFIVSVLTTIVIGLVHSHSDAIIGKSLAPGTRHWGSCCCSRPLPPAARPSPESRRSPTGFRLSASPGSGPPSARRSPWECCWV